METMTSYSFIIPVKPGGTITALSSLQDIPSTIRHEILVAEGTNPSRQRNLAAEQAQGDILYFMDDDSQLAINALEQCTHYFENKEIAVIGGPSLTPATDTFLQRLFGLLLSSLFGAGAMRNRYRSVGAPRRSSEKELILCNMAIRRDIFLELGGFDQRLYPNEENELLDRIQSKGLQLLHVPQLTVQRSQRPTLLKFIQQMYSYGRGRGQQSHISGKISLISLAPLLFILYLITAPMLIQINMVALLPLCCYGLFTLIFACEAGVRARSWNMILPLIPLFPIMHIANGCGLLAGLIRGKSGRSASQPNTKFNVRIITPLTSIHQE